MNTLTKPIIIPTPPDGFIINPNDRIFFERERDPKGNYVRNKCGRDLLSQLIQDYRPEWFQGDQITPIILSPHFGITHPEFLVWTGLTYVTLPKFLLRINLLLEINRVPIESVMDLPRMLIPERMCFYEAIDTIKMSLQDHIPVGLDLSMGKGGLYRHAMYVASCDDYNLYVYDSLCVPELEYRKLTPESDNRFVMRLPFSTIKKRWTRFNAVWQMHSLKRRTMSAN